MNVLIAFDGSEHAERLLDWVAKSGFSQATVLTVGPPQEVREGRRRRGRSFSSRPGYALPDELEKAVEKLELVGVSASSLDKSGHVAKTIAATAADGGFDLIVVGSARRHGWRKFFSRSIAEQIVGESPVSVLVVRSDVGG